ncbi:MAG: site-specific DNA-methyltransferase [Reyranellaceae bacterium]
MTNALYYGDNLPVLRESIKDESVDLIYLDPPFNSAANYNVLFKAPSGESSQAQIEAFEDTWHWNESAERAFDEVVTGPHSDASVMLKAMRSALGENDMMAYLAMMAVRLIELHRVLKPTGSLYLHCDPTASHYLKTLMDAIFGPTQFLNEIIWLRANAHNFKTRMWPRQHDTILVYARGDTFTLNPVYQPYGPEQLKRYRPDASGRMYTGQDMTVSLVRRLRQFEWRGTKPPPHRSWGASKEQLEEWYAEGRILLKKDGTPRLDGLKVYLDETKGKQIGTVWTDIDRISNTAAERLGYPTQKPEALLERIVTAGSNEGDLVLDPFCGCGTTVHAAQKLNRPWIGIDITHLAIGLIERRLREAFPGAVFEVHGVPNDFAGARDLAVRDKHEFQKWITGTIGAQPYKGGKKGMDRGIDGYLHFRDADNKAQFGIVSVKGGENITSAMVRDLKGTMDREKAALGLFLTLNPPSREMTREAVSAGFYETGGQKIPRLQILTAEEIVGGKRPAVPFGHSEGFRRAAREETAKQGKLL